MTDEQLRKLFHNLKNDLTSMTALINLHKIYKDSAAPEDLLNRLYERQTVIATAYEKLYQEGDYPNIGLISFINELLSRMHRNMTNHCERIEIRKDLADVRLPIKTITPLGQLLVELLTNSCRHAFNRPGSGNNKVEFHIVVDENILIIDYSDNGCGFPEGFDPDKARTLGMQLLKSLSRQLGGKPEFSPVPGGGQRCRIELKL